MNGSAEVLTRVPKPLRCTALHQSTVATSPGNSRSALTSDNPLQSSPQDSEDDDDDESSRTPDSSEDEEMPAVFSTELDAKNAQPRSFELRRGSTAAERRQARRPSTTAKLKQKNKGLTLNHTSPTTAARAINDVFTKRELSFDATSVDFFSPQHERDSFMAELPDAMARARKVHYRRDAMLPKPKSFARVQKALREDSAPCEVDVQKEATLARILKDKAGAAHEHGGRTQQQQQQECSLDAPLTFAPLHRKQAFLQSPVSTDAASGTIGTKSSDREDLLFNMDDIGTSIPSCLTSPTSTTTTTKDFDLAPHSGRAIPNRAGRTLKRKMDESRYEPYSLTMKRRAVSPSPSSPLGSPSVKTNVLRMEDLSL